MTTNPDEVTEAARRRTDLIADLAELGAWLKAADGDNAGIPEPATIQLRVPDRLDHEQKLAWLEQVAEGWQTETCTDGMGGRKAEKQLRVLRLTAGVAHPDCSVSGYKARAAARAANTGNGAAA